MTISSDKQCAERSRSAVAGRVLLCWCAFIGLGALVGAVGMLSEPDGSNLGMQTLLPYFQVLPLADVLYQDFVFPGIALLCVNGIPNFVAVYLLRTKRKAGILCGGVCGLLLMAWICIQFVILPANVMSTLYFIFGIAQALTAFAAWVFWQQEHFTVSEADYPNIGKDPTRLVVYFSRMGYTRRAAFECANRTGAQVYEVKSTEHTEGTLGFWWCGRYGMHGWDMPIEPIAVDLDSYERVTLCTPVWVFGLSAPMRSFCRAASGHIHRVEYIIVHFNPMPYANVAREMDGLLGLHVERADSLCVQYGRVKKEVTL